MAKRHDAPEIFAAGDRRRKRTRHTGEPGEIVRRRYVLEPVEANPGVFDPPADVDRLLDPPALIDVAHQIHLRPDRLANESRLRDFAGGRGDTRQAELHFRLAIAFFAQPSGRGDRFLELEATPQRAARVGGNPVAAAAQQLPQREAERLALDVPQRHVDRRHGHRHDPARAGAARSRGQFRRHGLDPQRILAHC